jgi:hypothetical protein
LIRAFLKEISVESQPSRSSKRLADLVRRAIGTTVVGVALIASGVLGGSVAHASSDTWNAPSAIPSAESSGAPALAQYDGDLYAMWIGQSSPTHLWYAAFNGKKWTKQAEVPSALTDQYTGVGLAAYKGSLYVAWEGKGLTPNRIFYSAFNGSTWTAEATVPSALTYENAYPALAAYDGSLYVEWYGSSGTHVWYSAFNGTSWTPQAEIPSATGAGAIEIGPALTVYKGELFATWATPSCCSELAYAQFNGAAWTAPSTFVATYDGNAGLALAVFDGVLYEGWDLYTSTAPEPVAYSTYNGTWLAMEEVPSANSTFGPGLAAYDGSLVVAWTKTGAGMTGPIDYSSGP